MVNLRDAVVQPRATSRAEMTTDRSPIAGIAIAFGISRNPAGAPEPAQPLTPIEVGRDCNVAPCSCVGVLFCPFDGLGSRVWVPGGRLAWAGEYGRPNRAGTDLDSRVAENQISRDWKTCG